MLKSTPLGLPIAACPFFALRYHYDNPNICQPYLSSICPVPNSSTQLSLLPSWLALTSWFSIFVTRSERELLHTHARVHMHALSLSLPVSLSRLCLSSLSLCLFLCLYSLSCLSLTFNSVIFSTHLKTNTVMALMAFVSSSFCYFHLSSILPALPYWLHSPIPSPLPASFSDSDLTDIVQWIYGLAKRLTYVAVPTDLDN